MFKTLGVFEWNISSIQGVDKAGNRKPRDLRWGRFDINNDGLPEIVITYRTSIRSTDQDAWEVLSSSDFSAIQKNGIAWDEYSPERISSADVDFADADGFGLTLAFMFPWTHAKRNYVVFQDVFFAHPELSGGSPRYVVLAEYKKDPYRDGGRWVPMKPICAVRDRK